MVIHLLKKIVLILWYITDMKKYILNVLAIFTMFAQIESSTIKLNPQIKANYWLNRLWLLDT